MKKFLALLVVGGLTVACSASGSKESEKSAPAEFSEMTRLRLSGSDGRISLELDATEAAAPRMAEVRVKWSGGWRLTKSEPGAAATNAAKKVVVQPMGTSEARILVFASDNTNILHSGPLAHFALEGGSGGAIDIVAKPPFLAPSAAESGLSLGDPLPL